MLMRIFPVALIFAVIATVEVNAAAERDAEAAQLAATGKSPDLEKKRPDKLPDLLKGERIPLPKKGGPITWNIGQTGMVGVKNGSHAGDQVRIVSVQPGTPAEGMVAPGDVLIGVQGIDFAAGGHLGLEVGNALVNAEEPANKGLFEIHIWRDLNWSNRYGKKDMFGVDVDDLFVEADEDNSLYDWQDEEEKQQTLVSESFDKFPILPKEYTFTLQLKPIGVYSDTSPFDCPAVDTIRENLLKNIANKMKLAIAQKGRNRGSWADAVALVASGKPEYVTLAKDWVGTQELEQDMNKEFTVYDVRYGGMQSWHAGFSPLEMAVYYDATGDKRVLGEIRKRAVVTALGQNGGGSWGHTFAFPHFNGGLLHRNNPGYGAMNNAGTRCFFLLTLAQKFGIKHPEIDEAIVRAERFFRTYVDKGCIPYGYHSPWPSDDSNGKNYGAAYAFYVLGKKYEAKYFSMCSAHASFSRRGGHGSPTLWYYTPLSQNISGPKVLQTTQQNMRWFFTLARKYDGSFVFQGEQAGIGGRGMRHPDAYHALYYSYPLKKTILTGKDADPDFWMTDEEFDELVAGNKQIIEPSITNLKGKPLSERSTDELIEFMDHWFPNKRKSAGNVLGERYKAGEGGILEKVLRKLDDAEPRMRAGAVYTLGQLGRDEVLSNMTKVTSMLKDDWEFVRMNAAQTIGKATQPGDANRELAVLTGVVNDLENRTMDNGNFSMAAKGVLFPRLKRGYTGPTTKLTTKPFEAGYDKDLVRSALERIVTMDPGGTIPKGWSKDTLIELAGHVVFSAEELQVNDAMFGGARKQQAQALLRTHSYREGYESDAVNLRKRSGLDRDMRRKVTFKDAYITPKNVKKYPDNYEPFLPDLYVFLHDKPNHVFAESNGKGNPKTLTPLDILIAIIEVNSTGNRLPTISDDVGKKFREELAASGDKAAQLALCHKELRDVADHNHFRKNHAMTVLEELLGADALKDVAPFIGHREPRVDQHARALAVKLVKQGKGNELIDLYQSAKTRDTGIHANMNAAMMLQVLADAEYKSAMTVIREALTHQDSKVRKQAVQALFQLGGDNELRSVLEYLVKSQNTDELFGCESALLSRHDASAYVARCSTAMRKMLPAASIPARKTLAFVLGQFGGEKNLSALKDAVMNHKDADDLNNIILGLAYSPDRSADQVMMALVKESETIRVATASLSVHRMVGPNGMKDVTDKERIDFAEIVLGQHLDPQLIQFLGKVKTARAVKLLYDVMKRGNKNTSGAVRSIIACAEGIKKPSQKDSQLVADVLTDVVEYIEVIHLRGGIKAQVKRVGDEARYASWQSLQARAGQALLKFHKPKKAPIPTFNEFDLDI